MTGPRWLRTSFVLVATGVLVGCGTPAVERPAVPGIEDARDARGADPCGLLPAERLAGLGLAVTGTPGRAAEGPRCEWSGDGGTLAVTLYTVGGGLATLAENSEPTTTRVRVAGYPALETFTGLGEFCQYDVGVAVDQALIVALARTVQDSCTVLQSVVPVLAGNLPPYRGTR